MSSEHQTASFRVFKELFTTTLLALKDLIPSIYVTHLVADTAYGTKDYLKLAALHDFFYIKNEDKCSIRVFNNCLGL